MREQYRIDANPFGEEPVLAPAPKRRLVRILLWVAVLDALLIILGISWYITSATTRRTEVVIDIPAGSTVREIGTILERGRVVRSADAFFALVRYRKADTALPSGVFLFKPGNNLFAVVDQLTQVVRGIERLRITIPEGRTTKQMTAIFEKQLSKFDGAHFAALVDTSDTYVFPDTYFFYSTATSGEVFITMEENFRTKTKSLRSEAESKEKKWRDVIIMAALIEEEAVEDIDRKMVSGILWNRIKLGMRLQVDASFAYLLEKASSEITEDDLKMDSPFNTYRYAGLPPAPIAHPGISSITASLYPTENAYLFYLSDKSGGMHYAKTFAEHKLNKERYLR